MSNKEYINYDDYYTEREFKDLLVSKGVDLSKFEYSVFKRRMKSYNKELADRILISISSSLSGILKEVADSMDYEFLKLLTENDLHDKYKIFFDNHFKGGIRPNTASRILNHDIARIVEEDNNIFTLVKKGDEKLVDIKDLFKWLEFRKSVTTIQEIYINLVEKIEEQNRYGKKFYIRSQKCYMMKIQEMFRNGKFDKYKAIHESDTPYRTSKRNKIYVNVKYESEIYKHLESEFVYSNNYEFYTSSEFKELLASKGIDLSKFNYEDFKRSIINYDEKLANRILISISSSLSGILKEVADSMDYEFLKLLQDSSLSMLYKTFIYNHFEGGITPSSASHILNCPNSTIVEIVKSDNNILTLVKREDEKLVKTKDVLKWLEFKKSVITIEEICINVVDTIEEKNRCRRAFYMTKIQEMFKNGEFDKYKVIHESDTPYRTYTRNQLYVNTKYESEIYKQLENELAYKTVKRFGSKEDIFNYKLKSIDTKNKKITLKEFSNFTISRISELSKPVISTYIYILDKIEQLDKEIMLYTTEEVEDMIETLPTKLSKSEFTLYLNKLKDSRDTKYSMIAYDRNHNRKKLNKQMPYTEEQYKRFGFLVLANDHIWYDEYMEKALEKRIHASVWLYAVLHYISAWRKGDILKKFPRPDLRMNPNVFLNKVRTKTLTKEEALDIIEQVNMRLKLWNLKPSKTKSNTNSNLVMEIPESIFVFLGTLIGIVEAHFQLSESPKKKFLLNSYCFNRDSQVDFFGEEFIEIFGEDNFSNLRAVKNYEIIMSRKADEKKLGTGYILASIARAHKFKLDKKAETTMVYLKYYKDMEDAEIIVNELFERGVCSFVPYMLAKIVAGENYIRSLPTKEKTETIKSITINMDAYESEMIMQGYDLAIERAKAKVAEIIYDKACNNLDPKKIAKDMLLNIIYNEAPSKQGDLSCMLVAQGKSCAYPKRENCVGCGHEMYLKSCLFELGSRIQQARQQALISKTQASKNKNILMIKNVLSPIVAEIFITLKEVYKIDNIDEFKRLIR